MRGSVQRFVHSGRWQVNLLCTAIVVLVAVIHYLVLVLLVVVCMRYCADTNLSADTLAHGVIDIALQLRQQTEHGQLK